MSARANLYTALYRGVSIDRDRREQLLDDFAHELAEKIRADIERNESIGVTGQYIIGMKRAHFLIDPYKQEKR